MTSLLYGSRTLRQVLTSRNLCSKSRIDCWRRYSRFSTSIRIYRRRRILLRTGFSQISVFRKLIRDCGTAIRIVTPPEQDYSPNRSTQHPLQHHRRPISHHRSRNRLLPRKDLPRELRLVRTGRGRRTTKRQRLTLPLSLPLLA